MAIWYSTTDCTYVAANQFKVDGNLTTQFPATIRVRVLCGAEWKYASVLSTSYDGDETTVTIDANVLTDPATSCEVGGATSGETGSVPDHDHSGSGQGGSDVTGTAPAHEVSNGNIRFRKPDDSWGDWFDISTGPRGPEGPQGSQGAQGAEGSGGVGGGGGFIPPDIIYKDNNEFTVPAGTYYSIGHRIKGQYQNLTTVTTWAKGSSSDVDITSAIVGGLSTVGKSWYSIFMTAESTFILLPYIRVDAISFAAGKTTINPAKHEDGTTADNTFVTGNDDFNNYRLVYLGRFDDSDDGTVWTISDTVNGTPDEIHVASDITSIVSATDWLQMVPADGEYLYLGTIQIDHAGTLTPFWKFGWRTMFKTPVAVNGNLATSAGDTDMALAMPPTAKYAEIHIYIQTQDPTDYYYVEFFYSGSYTYTQFKNRHDDTDQFEHEWSMGNLPVFEPSIIRNQFTDGYGGGDYQALGGQLTPLSWLE